jgi:hypothetical protein
MAQGALSQMQHNISMKQPALPNFTTPYYLDNGTQFNELDPSNYFDDSIDAATPDNYSDLYCPSYSFQNNITYLNVSCDTALNFSVPLYGEFCHPLLNLLTITLIDMCFEGTIAPFFILITLIANSAIVVVLSKKNMQTPTNAVLLG